MISPDRILYEDDHLLAVNKRSGELVVKGKGKVEKLPLFDFLKKDYPGLRVMHRLDFETSGVVVFAKDRAGAGARAGMQKKLYRALVVGRVAQRSGVIDKKLAARGQGNVEASTKYKVLKCWKDLSYIEAEIETGRHHQIRKHFANIGHPLVLDSVYGDEKFNRKFGREFKMSKFFLHAFSVELKHPITGKNLRIEAPMPMAFESVLAKL
ncbi:RluA family pseudouridine synthase [Patescibacteria group bacterium]|nr:RluA family pseudouridine synthase [Patescibacteria group bacterium]